MWTDLDPDKDGLTYKKHELGSRAQKVAPLITLLGIIGGGLIWILIKMGRHTKNMNWDLGLGSASRNILVLGNATY